LSLALTIGPATDYLYGLAADACTAQSVGVAVDGEPNTLELAMFVVGLDNPPPELSGETRWTGTSPILGGESAAEDYLIPCYIDVRQAADDQKTVRDIACGLFNEFWNALMADRSLGGVLAGGGAVVVNVTGTPRRVGTAAENGQRFFITFAVRCTDLQLG
jgi:hypothetical protein